MLPPRKTITSSSGLSLDGLPKVCPTEVRVTGLGTSIGIVDAHRVVIHLGQCCEWLFDY